MPPNTGFKNTKPNESDAYSSYIGLGSNLGDSIHILQAAVQCLSNEPQIQLLRSSSLYRSAPVYATGPDFINAVACVQTVLGPLALLGVLQQIEAQFGRERSHLNAPRTLDLDLLCHGQTVIQTPQLTLPHPRMHERAFVLLPLAEINAEFVIPGLGAVQTYLPLIADQTIQKLPG